MTDINNSYSLKIQKDEIDTMQIYGEYIKRKFFLECLYTPIETKNSFKYTKISFNSVDDWFNYISNTFIKNEDKSNFQIIYYNNKKFNYFLAKEKYNLYKTIKSIFNDQLEILKKIIKSPEDYCDSKFINKEEIQFLKNVAQYIILNYEIILYRLNIDKPFISNDAKYLNHPFYNFIRILNNAFKAHFDACFLIIYRNILDKYCLYMNDLFQLADIEDVIKNNYCFNGCPHFVFIPINRNDETMEKYIDIKADELYDSIKININNIHNLDSIQIANYVYEKLLNILFSTKESQQTLRFSDEILYFISKLDSKDKHNQIKFYARVHGLYIWDRVYIYKDKQSIKSICTDFNNNFPNRMDKKLRDSDNIVNLRRCFKGTLRSIETLSFMQLK